MSIDIEPAPKNSIYYYSFGTLFFPVARPDQIKLLIKSLLAADPPMPFIFGTAGAPPGLVDEISAMLTGEKPTMGIICGFAPQMFILNHMATGFFLVRTMFDLYPRSDTNLPPV